MRDTNEMRHSMPSHLWGRRLR